MDLNQYAAEKRLAIFDDLSAGHEPREGAYDPATLKEGRMKGKPQMGTVRFEPDALHLEFIYPAQGGSSTILTVSLTPPERIVMLPVPEWVVEQIWQGEIAGSFHFESTANRLVEAFVAGLAPEANTRFFGPQPARRRD